MLITTISGIEEAKTTAELLQPSTSANTWYSFEKHIQHKTVFRIESQRHLYRTLLIVPMQLLNAWICVCVLSHISQLLARLLLLLNENMKAFLPKLNIFDGRQLISKFQFPIVDFVTFCCSDESSVFCSFSFVYRCCNLFLNFVVKCRFCNFRIC